MRNFILFIFFFCASNYGIAQPTYPPLDSVYVSFPVKVAHAQTAWQLVNDANVRSAIATAVGSETDTGALVNVTLTGPQVATVYATLDRLPIGTVRQLNDILRATLMPFLADTNNAALVVAISAVEAANISSREGHRRNGEQGCREQAAAIRRNQ